jgi:hypothetical protein
MRSINESIAKLYHSRFFAHLPFNGHFMGALNS